MQFFILKVSTTASLLLISLGASAFAGYPSLPSNRGNRCPAQNQFDSDHFFDYSNPTSWAIHKRFCPQDTGRYTRRIVRSGQPTRQGVACLRSQGVTHVFDLRRNDEVISTVPREQQVVTSPPHNLTYYPVPLSSYGNRAADASWRAERIRGEHGPVTPHAKAQANANTIIQVIEETRRVLDRDPNAKVSYHCKQGKDRTGAVTAAVQAVLGGCTRHQIAMEMRYFHFHPYASLTNAMRIVYKRYGIPAFEDELQEDIACRNTQSDAQPLTAAQIPDVPRDEVFSVNEDVTPENFEI